MQKSLLIKISLILLIFILSFSLLYLARTVLIPVALAALLAMLFSSFALWLESHGVNRILAALICMVCVVLFLAGIAVLLTLQISSVASDINQFKMNLGHIAARIQDYFDNSLGLSHDKQDKILSDQQISGTGLVGKVVTTFMGSSLVVLFNLLLIMVYMVMFLYYRTHFKSFVLQLVPKANHDKTKSVIVQSAHVVQKYLSGLSIIIVILWFMYGIGYSIVGVHNAIFFAILCGVLEIIPFIGNMTGCTLTMLMAMSQGGGTKMILGVLIVYVIVQPIQTYIISPVVMNAEVKINPIFIILILLLGDLVWGIPGMILAIPMLGIVKIVCDNVEELKPYGFLIGNGLKRNTKTSPFLDKIRGWFR